MAIVNVNYNYPHPMWIGWTNIRTNISISHLELKRFELGKLTSKSLQTSNTTKHTSNPIIYKIRKHYLFWFCQILQKIGWWYKMSTHIIHKQLTNFQPSIICKKILVRHFTFLLSRVVVQEKFVRQIVNKWYITNFKCVASCTFYLTRILIAKYALVWLG